MDWSSWLLRSVSRSGDDSENSQNPNQQIPKPAGGGGGEGGGEEEQLGVTQQLIDHVKSFTIDTFKNFPLRDEATPSSTTTSSNVQRDLSEWQERHATLVLSKAKELSHLRFMLCPRHLKERQFWMIYFMLVKSHVAEYELHAIRLAKLKRMAIENEEPSNTIGFEVEMAETKQSANLAPPTS
ncbi:uncharacterized protein [Populus alba]|uniref:BSD domain-containing family protein n=1 Tax=Populus alba TaxID=43335 RepID=A0A4U5QSY4_POPAL|nr:uncharacterized protein LOC118049888 isoform X2 [Populus alba]TKS12045.1 BSD domain-containing family protein [Populus alba]